MSAYSPRQPRALKKISVNMGSHTELLDRLNQVTNHLKTTASDMGKLRTSPAMQRTEDTSSVDAVRQAVRELSIPAPETKTEEMTATERRLAESRRRFEASARERKAIEDTKKQQQQMIEAKRRAREAEEIARIQAEREAEKKRLELEQEAEMKRLEAEQEAELKRLELEQEAALFLQEEEEKRKREQEKIMTERKALESRQRKEEATAAAAANAARIEVARIREEAKKAQRDEAARAVKMQTEELKRREEALRARKLHAEAKALPGSRKVPPVLAAVRGEEEVFESQSSKTNNDLQQVPTASTFRSGWTSTPSMNNDDAFVRAPCGLAGTGYHKWNAFLPQPPGSQPPPQNRGVDFRAACSGSNAISTDHTTSMAEDETIEAIRFSDAPTNSSADDASTNTLFVVEPSEHAPPAPVRDYHQAMDDDASSVASSSDESDAESEISVEPPWSQVARRRSDAARRHTAADSQAKPETILEDLISESECRVKSGVLPDGASAVTVESVRRAVVAAIRNMSPEDLDAEVTSYDMSTGFFRVESKVKIASGQIVAMAVERSWADFIKARDGLLNFIGKDAEAQELARAIMTKIPRKRLKSMFKAKARNVLNGARRGELKWQSKQVAKLDLFVNSAVNLVSQIKAIATFKDDTFSWVSGFGRFETEDFGAFFTGLLTRIISA